MPAYTAVFMFQQQITLSVWSVDFLTCLFTSLYVQTVPTVSQVTVPTSGHVVAVKVGIRSWRTRTNKVGRLFLTWTLVTFYRPMIGIQCAERRQMALC